ncbi:Lipid-A-disaccharide synthase [Hyphomicrobiales bacterium]|nr:Lipid-A-disaccharide synthase [Hyphomicrobiales bacterium]CAH1701798.1 Lipid-A-disaccharide synthase [Hyphomicrobiales bacterium]CAI0345953.1 Lipid-A-disaccharide synthase [Hyphomicrobiales bacterium]
MRPFRLAIIAGEASGDALALRFLAALRQRLGGREIELRGVGDHGLPEAGLTSFFPQSDIAVMGFGPVIARLPLLLRRMEDAARGIVAFQPDLLLTIDSPDFCLRVAKKVRARAPDIPIVHWVCPSVWAWRSGRARRMAPHVDRILALLPFEPAALARLHGPETVYVGHPLMERLAEFRPGETERHMREDVARPLVLVLPGSRRSEITHMLPVYGEVVARVAASVPGARFVLPAVARLQPMIAEMVAHWPVAPEIVAGEAAKLAAFRNARAALATSGTVTLELALSQIPAVAAYRGAAWEAAIARRLIKLPSVILPNLIVGRSIMPEFIQDDATPEALSRHLLAALIEGPERQAQLEGFAEVETSMRSAGPSPAANAVDAALAVVAARSGRPVVSL